MRSRLRRPSLSSAVGSGLVLWGLAIGLERLHDNSFLTHLATGRLILEGGIPRVDPFSFTAPGHPWTVQSWGAAALFALAEKAGGGHGIQLLHALLTTLLAGLVWRLSRPADVLLGRVIAATAVLVIGTVFWTERPLLFGLVLLATVVLLVEADRGPPWWLLAVMWLWVNTHGSFPLGVLYLLVRLVGRKLDGHPVDRLARLSALSLAGVAIGALNPLGLRLLLFPLRVLTNNDAFAEIAEWRSPDFSRPANLVFLAFALGALLLLVRHPNFEDGLVCTVFAALGCIAVRNIPVAAIAVLPAAARGLRGMGTVRGEGRSPVSAAAMGLVVVLGAVVTASAMDRPSFDLERYPVAELGWMDDQGLLRGRVATQDFVGNLVTARRVHPTRVFIDDRYDMYPDAVRRDYLVLHKGGDGWQQRLDTYGVTAVLWQRSAPLASLLAVDPRWRIVRRTDSWLVAVRS